MNLGLDIDGVLTNIEAFHFQYGIPFFRKKFQKEVVNESGKDIKQIFECSEEEYKKFWSKYLFSYVTKWPVREFASDYTKWAYANGHKIYIVTSRVFAANDDFMGKLMRFLVRQWLKKNKICYEKIIFCNEDKTLAIQEYEIRYMVEDDPNNIEVLKHLTEIICMDAKCNAHISDERVKRCYSFNQVLDYMKQRTS